MASSSSSNNFISELSEKKYINVETYRKNGESVRTPVWFGLLSSIIRSISEQTQIQGRSSE